MLLDNVFRPLWKTHVVEGGLVPELGALPAAPTLAEDRLQVITTCRAKKLFKKCPLLWCYINGIQFI